MTLNTVNISDKGWKQKSLPPLKGKNILTQYTTLSHEMKVSIPNPGLSYDEWFYADQNEERRRDISVQLGFFVLLALTFVLAFSMEKLHFLTSLGLIMGLTLLGFVAIPYVARHVEEVCKHKQAVYRNRRADDLRSAFAQRGFTVIPDEGKTVLETLATNNYPKLQNAQMVRYNVQYTTWEKTEITLFLNFIQPNTAPSVTAEASPTSEVDGEKEQGDESVAATQDRIDDIIKEYESNNGVMSDEKRSGFEEALKTFL